MKKLQCNFTTLEQSKRLLELGVPADSADMYIECYWCDGSNGRWRYKTDSHEMFGDRKQIGEGVGAIIPCWSVGRLIEIYHICVSRGFSFNVCFPNLMNEIMYKLAEANNNGWLNLKKLEE